MYENKKPGFMFVLPFVLGVLLFNALPFVMSFALSFTQYDLIDAPDWVGMRNCEEMLTGDPLFSKSLGVTLTFALVVAQVLNFKLKGINAFSAAFYRQGRAGGAAAGRRPAAA